MLQLALKKILLKFMEEVNGKRLALVIIGSKITTISTPYILTNLYSVHIVLPSLTPLTFQIIALYISSISWPPPCSKCFETENLCPFYTCFWVTLQLQVCLDVSLQLTHIATPDMELLRQGPLHQCQPRQLTFQKYLLYLNPNSLMWKTTRAKNVGWVGLLSIDKTEVYYK